MSIERPRTHWRGAHEQPLPRRRARRQRRSVGVPEILIVAAIASGAMALASPRLFRGAASVGGERSVYYPDCQAAFAAGAAPIYAGQPGYRATLDRDLDGIACEPLPSR